MAGSNLFGDILSDISAITEAAQWVEGAVTAVLSAEKVRTPDLGGNRSVQEVTDAVLDKLG